MRRLNNHAFAAQMQNILCPELAKYPYTSGFIAKEYLNNRIYSAILSRIRKKSWKHIPNFPLNDFINNFVSERLKMITADKSIVSTIFNTVSLFNHLQANDIRTTESFWLKYTTPVQMDMTLKNFS